MTALILTEGGNLMGYGHVTRCIALYDAFDSLHVDCRLIINGTKELENLIGDRSYIIMDWQSQLDTFLQESLLADIVLVDSYRLNISEYEQISRAVDGLTVYLDDDNRLEYPEGIIINPVQEAMSIDYKRKPKDLLLGNEYFPFRKEFWNVRKETFNPKMKQILIILGASDIRNLCSPLIDYIRAEFPELKLDVVITSSYNNKAELIQKEEDRIVFHTDPPLRKLINIMLDADLAISAAGQTMFELVSIGVPTLAIGLAENQRNNLKSLMDSKSIEFISFWNDNRLFDKLSEGIIKLMDTEPRMRLSKVALENISSKGVLKSVKKLIDRFGKDHLTLREASLEDSQVIFELSNDSFVRENSINKESILWTDHVKWFSEKLSSDKCRYFVVFDISGDFAGQVRYDLDGEVATVGLSITEEFRGKGFAPEILKRSAALLFEESLFLKAIKAYIHVNNKGSEKSFIKAGYNMDSLEVMAGEKYNKYCLDKKS